MGGEAGIQNGRENRIMPIHQGANKNVLRILFICDIQNLFYGVRKEFGIECRLNYYRLLQKVKQQYSPFDLHAVAYLALTKNAIHQVVSSLENVGYKVFWKVSREFAGGRSRTDIDAQVVADVIDDIDNFDTLVLASGDGDFVPLYKYIQKKGKKVEIVAFRSSLNEEVHKIVDRVHYLDKDVVFCPAKGVT